MGNNGLIPRKQTIFATRSAPKPPLCLSTPKQEQENAKASQVALPTPSKLPRFLEYAGQNLGVPLAPSFESPMHKNGYGPDILHLLDDRDLMDIGINKGDVIHLKAGAQLWWNGPEANKNKKCSRAEMEEASTSLGSGRLFPPVRNQPRTTLATLPSKQEEEMPESDNEEVELDLYNPTLAEDDDHATAAAVLAGLHNA
ncbi:hypothetical protein C8R44DRAFT_749026 [Mycena epipterygia]|nr:hypothetical protein C8R44DRAFT_749026 [Mycena epipterygia]